MIIVVDPDAALPPYEQLRQQITTMVEAGTLPAGHRLPSVRQLAADLGLANGTVARTYRELELAGLVSTNGRRGTVVQPIRTTPAADRRTRLRELAESFARAAAQLNATPAEVTSALKEVGLTQ
jgi:GntR family transcriptional regulator